MPELENIEKTARILAKDLYSAGEEIANALTHGIGALLGVAALTLMILLSVSYSDTARVISSVIYGSSLILLYLASTLYHSIQSPGARKFFQILDHCAIYILIAGTYTPFMLISLNSTRLDQSFLKGTVGYSLLVAIWTLAIFGIILKAIFHDRYAKVSLFTYLAMGWICILVSGEMLIKVPADGLHFYWPEGLPILLGRFSLCLIAYLIIMQSGMCSFLSAAPVTFLQSINTYSLWLQTFNRVNQGRTWLSQN